MAVRANRKDVVDFCISQKACKVAEMNDFGRTAYAVAKELERLSIFPGE